MEQGPLVCPEWLHKFVPRLSPQLSLIPNLRVGLDEDVCFHTWRFSGRLDLETRGNVLAKRWAYSLHANARRLRGAGVPVAPRHNNGKPGRRSCSVLWSEDLRDVVLVGASAGGMVMAKTAELASDRIERLVFSDALALMHGKCIRDITCSQMSFMNDLAI